MDAPSWNGAPGACKSDRERVSDDPREWRADPVDYCSVCGQEIRSSWLAVPMGDRVELACGNECCQQTLRQKMNAKAKSRVGITT
jgi:hypothetical protein